jgi:hypothetical protein
MIVNLSDYSAEVVGGDWTPALDAAWDDVKATGGKIIFDVNCELRGRTTFTNASTQCDLTLEGEPGVQILVNTSNTELPMNVGDKGKFIMRGLNFKGDGSGSNQDCGQVVIMSNCIRAIVEDCVFAGIKTNGNGIIEAGSGTNLVVRDSIVSGNSGICIHINGAKSAEINNVQLLDYYTLNGFYHGKTGEGVQWIKANTPPPAVLGAETPVIKIVNCQMDEASFHGVHIEDYPKVDIERCRVNNSSSGSAAGFYLEGVKHARIFQCHVGYNFVDIPMVEAHDVERLRIVNLTRDDDEDAPSRIEVDSATIANLKLLDSPGITVTEI